MDHSLTLVARKVCIFLQANGDAFLVAKKIQRRACRSAPLKKMVFFQKPETGNRKPETISKLGTRNFIFLLTAIT